MNVGKNGHPTTIFERVMQEDPNLAHTDIIIFKKMLFPNASNFLTTRSSIREIVEICLKLHSS